MTPSTEPAQWPANWPALGCLAALLVGACGASPNRQDVPTRRIAAAPAPDPSAPPSAAAAGDPEAAPEGAMPVVVYVAGQSIGVDELLEAWLFRESYRVREYLEDLVIERLVVAESRRLGITLPPERVDEAMAETHTALAEEVERIGGGLSVEDFIERRLSLDVDRYMARLTEGRTNALLADRCVRSWVLTSDRVEVRVIVLEDRERVKELEERVRARDDFAVLLEEYNTGDTGDPEGRIPPVVRSDSALSRLAFTTPVGQVGGPIFENGTYLFLRADARPQPISGTWDAIGPVVEQDLLDRPVEEPERWQWKGALLERYEVDLTPFLDLVGLPPPGESSGAGR